jgi:hypothetical protein
VPLEPHFGRCTECGSNDEVEHIADLAPGEPWLVCRPCLARFAGDSLVAELRRRGVPATVVQDITAKRRRVSDGPL